MPCSNGAFTFPLLPSRPGLSPWLTAIGRSHRPVKRHGRLFSRSNTDIDRTRTAMLPTDPVQGTERPKKKPTDRDSFLIAFGVYGAVGFQLVASLLVGVFLGQWLDKKWGTDPWMMFTG